MAGISSKAAGVLENKKQKFQGQEFANNEFSDGSGLDMYEFKYRFADPQTGRFWSIDPLANDYLYNSPYAFSENKVTSHIELEGLEAVTIKGRENHHAEKKLYERSVNPKEMSYNSTKYGGTNMIPEKLATAQSIWNTFSDSKRVDLTTVNQQTSVSETVTRSNAVIEDNPIGAGQILTVSITTKVTVVSLDGEKVKGVNQTTTSSLTTYSVVSVDTKNSVTIKSLPIAATTTTFSSVDPNNVSPGLKKEVNTATEQNKAATAESMKNIEKGFDDAKDMFKPIH